MHWLPAPDPGTRVCGGFDGSDVDDATVIRLETRAGVQFPPRSRPARRPTIWLHGERAGVSRALPVLSARAELAPTYSTPGVRD